MNIQDLNRLLEQEISIKCNNGDIISVKKLIERGIHTLRFATCHGV